MFVAIDPSQLRGVCGGVTVEVDTSPGAQVTVTGADVFKQFVNGKLVEPSKEIAAAKPDAEADDA